MSKIEPGTDYVAKNADYIEAVEVVAAAIGIEAEAKAMLARLDVRLAEKVCRVMGFKRPNPWVVERTIGWLNRCRGILIRYEKKAANYLAVVQLACALLWYRRLHRLTT